MSWSTMIWLFIYIVSMLAITDYVVDKVYKDKTPKYRYWTYRSFSFLVFCSSYIFVDLIEDKLTYTAGHIIWNSAVIWVIVVVLDKVFGTSRLPQS